MKQAKPDMLAPRRVVDLPRYWELRRLAQGKTDPSNCAADLRQALIAERGRWKWRRMPMPELVVLAIGLFIAMWTGVRIWAEQPAGPPIQCICEEVPCIE